MHSQPVFGELVLAGSNFCAEFAERDPAEVELGLQPLIRGACSGGIESVLLAKLLKGLERVLGSKAVGYQHTADVEVKSEHVSIMKQVLGQWILKALVGMKAGRLITVG
jgi:hypothetical protein